MNNTINTQQINCPICKGSDYVEIKQFPDAVTVGRCKQCNMIYTPIADNKPEDLFGGVSFENLKFSCAPIVNGTKSHFRKNIFNKYLNKITKYSNGKKHLDVGCAHGFFLDMSKQRGHEVLGIEPNKVMAQFGKEILNLNIHNGVLSQVKLQGAFDMITFTDSLEYFIRPVDELSKLFQTHLHDKGIVFIKVPNGDYFNMRYALFGGDSAFSPSKRVAHYNYNTIKKLGKALNLKIVKVGFFKPIDSPVWDKLIGLHLQIASPWWLDLKGKWLRQMLHIVGLIEFFLIRKNHFSQSVYIVLRKD